MLQLWRGILHIKIIYNNYYYTFSDVNLLILGMKIGHIPNEPYLYYFPNNGDVFYLPI